MTLKNTIELCLQNIYPATNHLFDEKGNFFLIEQEIDKKLKYVDIIKEGTLNGMRKSLLSFANTNETLRKELQSIANKNHIEIHKFIIEHRYNLFHPNGKHFKSVIKLIYKCVCKGLESERLAKEYFTLKNCTIIDTPTSLDIEGIDFYISNQKKTKPSISVQVKSFNSILSNKDNEVVKHLIQTKSNQSYINKSDLICFINNSTKEVIVFKTNQEISRSNSDICFEGAYLLKEFITDLK